MAVAVYVPINHLQQLHYRSYCRMINDKLKTQKRVVRKEKQGGSYTVVGAIGGAFFGVLLTIGTGAMMIAILIGATVGAAAAMFLQHAMEEMRKTKMMRELAVLYEIIDFFTQGEGGTLHFTIRQALQYGVVITPTIRPYVQRCIDSYPRGPARALERFAMEVNLPEASILTTVLTHAETVGMQYVRTTITEGTKDLEDLRQTLAEVKIAGKPVYYTIYRALPAAAVGGIVFGALINHFTHIFALMFNI